MAKNTKLWSDKKITQDFAPYDRGVAKEMRNEYETELEKARTELAAANAKVAELTETCATLTRINSEVNYTADILAAMVKEE